MKKYIISYQYISETEKWNWQFVWQAEDVYEAIENTKELVREIAIKNWEKPFDNPIVVTSVYSEETGVEAEITKYRSTLVFMIMFFCLNISNNVFVLIINAVCMLYCSYLLYKS